VLKKPNPKNDVVDVPADNTEGTMERFNDGLRRVLAAPKTRKNKRSRKKRTQ